MSVARGLLCGEGACSIHWTASLKVSLHPLPKTKISKKEPMVGRGRELYLWNSIFSVVQKSQKGQSIPFIFPDGSRVPDTAWQPTFLL